MRKLITLSFNALIMFSTMSLNAYPTNSPTNSSANNTRTNTSSAAQDRSNNAKIIDWCENYTDSVRQAKELSKPLLILFTGTGWCPACIKLEREVLQKPEFIQGVNDNFVFYKAEFTDPSPEGLNSNPDSALLDRYQVNAFPTILVVDNNGKQLFTVDYKAGGADAYVREINQKLQSSKNSMRQNPQSYQQKRGI